MSIYIYKAIYTTLSITLYVSPARYIYIYIYIYIDISFSVYIITYIYICLCIYMYIYTYIYISITLCMVISIHVVIYASCIYIIYVIHSSRSSLCIYMSCVYIYQFSKSNMYFALRALNKICTARVEQMLFELRALIAFFRVACVDLCLHCARRKKQRICVTRKNRI